MKNNYYRIFNMSSIVRYVLIILLLVLTIVISSFVYINIVLPKYQKKVSVEKKIKNDDPIELSLGWRKTIILCKECNNPNESFNKEEIQNMTFKILNKMDKKYYKFVDYIGNNEKYIGFIIDITNEGENYYFFNRKFDFLISESEDLDFKIKSIEGVYKYKYSQPQLEPINKSEITICSEDSDCIWVKKDCCGCQAGGSSTVINKKYLKYWEDSMGAKCEDTVCLQVWNCGNIKENNPACVNSQCTMKK